MECENKAPQKDKSATFSQTEIDAAILLLQLSSSSADSQDRNSHSHSHSSNSVSVLSKPQPSSPSDAMIEDVLAEIEEDERLRRKVKRFRYVHDLYNVTHVLPPSPFKDN